MNMVATAEIPILTPRTLDLLREAIPPDKERILRDGLERIRPLLGDFLTQDNGDVDESFVIASSRYVHPRLRLLLVLLSSVDLAQVPGMVAEVSQYASNMLLREGWRLGKGVKLLREAWDTYGAIGTLLAQNIQALGQVRELPYGWLMASTRMDFSLTATSMYLEGEFPDARESRLRYLCGTALEGTSTVLSLLRPELDPSRLLARKSGILRALFGSWQDDDRADDDLRRLYESRRLRRIEPD
jgi:hypothetical protein